MNTKDFCVMYFLSNLNPFFQILTKLQIMRHKCIFSKIIEWQNFIFGNVAIFTLKFWEDVLLNKLSKRS